MSSHAGRWVQRTAVASSSGVPARIIHSSPAAYTDYDAKLGLAWTALNAPLRDAPANYESADLVLFGRLLSRIHSGEAQHARKVFELLSASPADNKAEAQPQLSRQQAINLRIELLKDLIRAEANEQNILKKDGRDRMRDADDMLAALQDPPPKAEEELKKTTEDEQAGLQKWTSIAPWSRSRKSWTR